jgi:hypothetical protein
MIQRGVHKGRWHSFKNEVMRADAVEIRYDDRRFLK